MPTITVESTINDPVVHRHFARSVSEWLSREGVDLNHVITKFVVADPHRVFSGPFLLAGGDQEPAAFAFARCTIGSHRAPEFRSALAGEIVDALAPAVAPERIFIQFELADPGLHISGAKVGGKVAGNLESGDLTTDARDRTRLVISELLEATLDAANDRQALVDAHPRYDSLAVLDAVGRVEQAFGIRVDLVDDDLRTTFVSIESIAALVERKLADQVALASDF
jgi:acyl carrier protein